MNRALEIFGETPRRCNCAQAVAAGLGHDELLPRLGGCGGGNAPEGRCGALHAALLIVGESRSAEVREAFVEAVGSEFCRVLKRELGVPCSRCVDTAAGIAEKYQKGNTKP